MIKKITLSTLGILLGITVSNAQFKICNTTETIEELKTSLCTIVQAPLYHKKDNNETIDLFVRKFPAKEKREGSLWLIAGGPGESGASFYSLVDQFKNTFPNFDILIPDHRGTGLSGKICPEQERIDSDNGIGLGNEEWGACFGQMFGNLEYTKAFSITNGAKDLSMLINTLSGEGKRYVYGVSYGTQLVLRLILQGTVNLDGVILDSLVPLQDDVDFDLSKRSQVTDNVGRKVLEGLEASDSSVSLISRLQSLIDRVKTDEKFAAQIPNKNLAMLLGMTLDIPKVRNTIPSIIEGLEKNDFTALNKAVEVITSFYKDFSSKYPTATNSIPLVQIITASENNLRPEMKKDEVAKEAEKLLFTSPLPFLIAENKMPTYERDQFFAMVPENMPRTLILSGTLDPKTHFDGAKRYFKKLSTNGDVTFVGVVDTPHFVALFAPDAFAKIAKEFVEGKSIETLFIKDELSRLKTE